ncbi:hypothetical protein [Sulfolobus sp. E11-6]|nr:hypothetical protein [Sulfolobus sp. E11-6]QGA68042.1 hypothetical protein GFS33_03860 [Sulfolobus sp. E11-6]
MLIVTNLIEDSLGEEDKYNLRNLSTTLFNGADVLSSFIVSPFHFNWN